MINLKQFSLYIVCNLELRQSFEPKASRLAFGMPKEIRLYLLIVIRDEKPASRMRVHDRVFNTNSWAGRCLKQVEELNCFQHLFPSPLLFAKPLNTGVGEISARGGMQ